MASGSPATGSWCGLFVAGQLERQQPVQVSGDDRQRDIQAEIEPDATG